MTKPTLLFVVGTRPEAIKCAPVILECKNSTQLNTKLAVTSQHKELQYGVLNLFNIVPDVDFDLMAAKPDLVRLVREVWTKLCEYILANPVNMIAVQGDTTTAFIAALSAAYHKVPIVHIEAGLRTFNRNEPFPEEMNRTLITHIAGLHMAPTRKAKENLLREGIDESTIRVVGNSGIDALHYVINNINPEKETTILSEIKPDQKIILVTCHRRENWGKNIEQICEALKRIAEKHDELAIVFPVHPNPIVKDSVHSKLDGVPNILLKAPVEYDEMAVWMKHAHLVLTDSGGIQEEAPTLGKPVLVLRNHTERDELLSANSGILAGTETEKIVKLTHQFLTDESFYQQYAAPATVFGDGKAAQRIRQYIEEYLKVH